MRLALIQLGARAGDVDDNLARMLDAMEKAAGLGARRVVFPSCSLTGFALRSLVGRQDFAQAARLASQRAAQACKDLRLDALFGAAGRGPCGAAFDFAALGLANGGLKSGFGELGADRFEGLGPRVPGTVAPAAPVGSSLGGYLLPYEPIGQMRGASEARAETRGGMIDWDGARVWVCSGRAGFAALASEPDQKIDAAVVRDLGVFGADRGAGKARGKASEEVPFPWLTRDDEESAQDLARRLSAPVFWVRAAQAQEDLVFLGSSFAVDSQGRVVARAAPFDQEMLLLDWEPGKSLEPVSRVALGAGARSESRSGWGLGFESESGSKTAARGGLAPDSAAKADSGPRAPKGVAEGVADAKRAGKTALPVLCPSGFAGGEPQALYEAAVAGLRSYAGHCGFKRACLGLSGGVDSALCLAIAVDALGAENCEVLILPGAHTSRLSLDLASSMADGWGVKSAVVSIQPVCDAFSRALSERFAGLPEDVTEENLQARARGILLMALSNKTGALLLSTGNKSEVAVGYCTLYGDTNGGYNPLKDMFKTEVYAVCAWLNGRGGKVIPRGIVERAPSAELRDGQTDQDSLPPYDRLDAMLKRILFEGEGLAQLRESGYDGLEAQRVLSLMRAAQFKRAQSCPGPKLSAESFGREWALPSSGGFRPR